VKKICRVFWKKYILPTPQNTSVVRVSFENIFVLIEKKKSNQTQRNIRKERVGSSAGMFHAVLTLAFFLILPSQFDLLSYIFRGRDKKVNSMSLQKIRHSVPFSFFLVALKILSET
jgi:hypothetical protein